MTYAKNRIDFNNLISFYNMSESVDVLTQDSAGEIVDLKSLIAVGTKTEEQQGLALRAVQMGMAANFCSEISSLHRGLSRAQSVLSKLRDKYFSDVEEVMDTLSPSEVASYMSTIQNQVMGVLELERKVIQGRELFPTDSLSDMDRKILRLVSSLRAPEDRAKFMKLIEDNFGDPTKFEDMDDDQDVAIPAAEVEASVVSDARIVDDGLTPEGSVACNVPNVSTPDVGVPHKKSAPRVEMAVADDEFDGI